MNRLIRFCTYGLLAKAGFGRRRTVVAVALPMAGWLTVGAAIGAGIGLVFAPSSGRRLRQDMGERLDTLRHRVQHRWEEARA
jgi:hypothetical protein